MNITCTECNLEYDIVEGEYFKLNPNKWYCDKCWINYIKNTEEQYIIKMIATNLVKLEKYPSYALNRLIAFRDVFRLSVLHASYIIEISEIKKNNKTKKLIYEKSKEFLENYNDNYFIIKNNNIEFLNDVQYNKKMNHIFTDCHYWSNKVILLYT